MYLFFVFIFNGLGVKSEIFCGAGGRAEGRAGGWESLRKDGKVPRGEVREELLGC